MRPRGFSLIELSIVLVIIGLVVGGIMTGQSLIRSAELRNIITGVDNLRGAAFAFRDKYFAWPGDMKNATAFWGAQFTSVANCNANYNALPSVTGATCDGDGNGRIDQSYEHYRAFQQLDAAHSGLIGGSFTGMRNDGVSSGTFAGKNVMGTRRNEVGIDMVYRSGGGNSNVFDAPPANYLELGGSQWNYDSLPNGALTAIEAWNYDKKADDGLPRAGKILVPYTYAYNPTCIDATNSVFNVTASEVVNSAAVAGGCQLQVFLAP